MRRIRPNREGLLYPFLLLLDFLLLLLGFYMALQMSGYLALAEVHYNGYVWLWVLLGSACTLGLFNLYGVFQSPHQGLRECFLSVSIALVFMNSSWALLDMLIPEFHFPLSWILLKLLTEFVLISGTKLFFHRILSILHKEASTAIIGEKAETLRFLETIFHKNQSLFSVQEILIPDDPRLLQKISRVEVIFICPKVKGSMKKKLVRDCFQLGKHNKKGQRN